MAISPVPEAGVSTAPDGQTFPLPDPATLAAQWDRVQRLAAEARAARREIVVIQGLGFVGAAVAAAVSSARLPDGTPRYLVLGIDLATAPGYWKVAKVNLGLSPFDSPDPGLAPAVRRGVLEAGNLAATVEEAVYGLADVVVVDVPLDVADRSAAEPDAIHVEMGRFEEAIGAIGRHLRADALVLVETTVPMGTTERVVQPILREAFAARGLQGSPLVAHCYERVMPGPRYLESIQRFWRTFAGVDGPSAARARAFLEGFIDTAAYPLTEVSDPMASELGKLLENSYRATNIAFIHEWTLAAEDMGVNLFEVVDAIRVRKGTHDNMRYPGFGVGGYCLTKDSLLAQWSLTRHLGSPVELGLTLESLRINYLMPRHTLDLLSSLLGPLEGRRVALCGVAYLPEVPDTRNSPSELFALDLLKAGARLAAHDPITAWWPELPHIPIRQDLPAALAEADGIVLATPHRCYIGLDAAGWLAMTRPGAVLVDAMNILSDPVAEALHAGGRRLLGVGKGHWRKRGFQL